MAHIYIFSPSSAVRDKAAFRRGIKRLKAQGHEVEVDESALDTHMRFAGDDATRIAAITRAAASGADVALISRGGYGLTRILPDLPYKKIAKAIAQGNVQAPYLAARGPVPLGAQVPVATPRAPQPRVDLWSSVGSLQSTELVEVSHASSTR
mgnify:CR=1 FL=1